MKKPTKNLITEKLDIHTAKMENKAHDRAMEELVKTRDINDGGRRNATTTLVYQNLAITPYKSEKTMLHTKADLLPVLASDGIATSKIPVQTKRKTAKIVQLTPPEEMNTQAA
jgi:hypothetical protein